MNATQPTTAAAAKPEITQIDEKVTSPSATAIETPQQAVIPTAATSLPLTDSSTVITLSLRN